MAERLDELFEMLEPTPNAPEPSVATRKLQLKELPGGLCTPLCIWAMLVPQEADAARASGGSSGFSGASGPSLGKSPLRRAKPSAVRLWEKQCLISTKGELRRSLIFR